MDGVEKIAPEMSTKHRRTLSLVKYAGSHVAERSVNLVKKGRRAIGIKVFLYLSNIVLLVAIFVGLYARWQLNSENFILWLSILGIIIFLLSGALMLYTSFNEFGMHLARLWIGALLGLLAFTQKPNMYGEITQMMDSLFITSICLKAFDSLIRRILGYANNVVLLSKFECIELIGLMCSSTLFHSHYLSIALLSLAFISSIIGIRLKSLSCLIQLVAFLITARLEIFPRLFQIHPNVPALAAFASRFCFSAAFDLYFGAQSQLERWKKLLRTPSIIRKFSLILLFIIQIAYLTIHSLLIKNHKEWFIVVPLFGVFSAIWCVFHLAFIACCWTISNRITLCNQSYYEDKESYSNVLASRGVRHLALTASRLVKAAVFLTFLITIISWRTKTALSLSLACFLLPLELAICSLVGSFGSKLGGTCIGYALVAPAVNVRPDLSPTLLPSSHVADISGKATTILNVIQQFFVSHLIDNAGCDYTSSGVTLSDVKTKLCSLFSKRTSDGPRYDTYIIYYSGHAHQNGDWALADNDILKFDYILQWWKEQGDSGSRLIIIVDADKAYNWSKVIRRADEFVALQTWVWRKGADLENSAIGCFTHDWATFNSETDNDIDWLQRPYRCIYSVSSDWPDFRLQTPSGQDVLDHWGSCVPKITRPLLKFVSTPNSNCFAIFSPCECVIKCLRKLRMAWIPPRHIDTSHGFKLFRT